MVANQVVRPEGLAFWAKLESTDDEPEPTSGSPGLQLQPAKGLLGLGLICGYLSIISALHLPVHVHRDPPPTHRPTLSSDSTSLGLHRL